VRIPVERYEHLSAALFPRGSGKAGNLEDLSALFESKDREEKARLNRLWKGLKSLFG